MTREEADKWAELMRAYADGKAMQFLGDGEKWHDMNVFDFDCELSRYRIKPEPKKAEFWVNVYGSYFGEPHSSKIKADASAAGAMLNRTACLHIVREYEEGEGL